MKKIIISCLIVCLFTVLAQTALGGVQPDEKAAVILEGFDDLLQEDLGSADGAVSGFDTHYDLGYGDGSMQLVQTNVSRQGDRKSTRLNSSHSGQSRMPSSA